MSLINQVLKDLEKRRAENVNSANGSFNTVPRYAVARSNNNLMLYMLGILAIATSVIAAILIWDRGQNTFLNAMSPASSSTNVVNIEQVPSDVKHNNVKSMEEIKLGGKVVYIDNEIRSDKKTIANNKNKNKKIENTSVAKANDEIIGEDDTFEKQSSVQASVRKQQRPLSPEQITEVAFQKGYNALEKGQTKKAEIFLREALQSLPNHIKSREILTGLYIKAGRYVEAGQLLFEGIGLSPEYTMYRKLYARVLLEQSNLATAVKVLEQYSPSVQVDTDYYALLAALYQRQGKHENAAALYQQMLKQNKTVGIWWIGLGISLEKMDKPDAARTAYEKARSSGTLAIQMAKYTDNRLTALKDIGYPD